MGEAGDAPRWKRRFRAARISLPTWGLEAPERLTYATNASGVWQLSSWDRATGTHTQVTDKPTGVWGGQPTPDGTGVVWFDDGDGDEVGRYVVTPFDGGTPTPLLPDLEVGWSSGVSMRPGRVAVGVSTREGHRLVTADDDGWRTVYLHPSNAAVGALSRDGALLAISHTEHGDVLHPWLRIVDAVSGEGLAEVADGPGYTTSPAAWSPVPGDQRLALLSERTGRERPEIWAADDGRRRPLAVDLPGEVWVADWWPDGSALLLGHDHLGRTELWRYDLARDVGEPVDVGEQGTVRGARVRPDGTIWFAFASSARPSQVRAWTAPGRSEVLLRPPGEPAPEGAAFTSLHYDNGEGGRVHAFLAMAADARRPPLVVDVHGGPHAQTDDSFIPDVQAWVDHGYAVLMPNYRGSTGYGKAWEDALQGDPGGPELVDVLAGIRHLVALDLVDADRVALTGASWGGYLTLLALGRHPDLWAAGVAVVPVADYLAAYADESPDLQGFDRSLFGGSPEEVGDLYRERSPITYVDRVRAPVLIITGRNDTRCPLRQVDRYVARLRELGKVHAYDVFDAGHGSLDVEESIRQAELALDFVGEHLGMGPAQR